VSRSLVFVSTSGILGKHEQSLTRCTEPQDPAFMGFDLKVMLWKFVFRNYMETFPSPSPICRKKRP
jgi:hypothetical protein